MTAPKRFACRRRLRIRPAATGRAPVNVAAPTDPVRLAGPRIDRRDNRLGDSILVSKVRSLQHSQGGSI